MFVPPEQRSIPPRWDPPGRKPARARRREDARTAIIALAAVVVLFGPELAGAVYMLVRALARH